MCNTKLTTFIQSLTLTRNFDCTERIFRQCSHTTITKNSFNRAINLAHWHVVNKKSNLMAQKFKKIHCKLSVNIRIERPVENQF